MELFKIVLIIIYVLTAISLLIYLIKTYRQIGKEVKRLKSRLDNLNDIDLV